MSTAYSTLNFAQRQPSGTGHGFFKTSTHLHAISGVISTWALNDTIAIGWLPRNATVVGCILKAASQLDSGGAPTLAIDVGIVGAPQQFMAAVTSVGHAAGATVDDTLAPAGALYQNTSGNRVEVVITVHTAAETPQPGTLELDIEYYVEDPPASNP
jgi:hypothetical protein